MDSNPGPLELQAQICFKICREVQTFVSAEVVDAALPCSVACIDFLSSCKIFIQIFCSAELSWASRNFNNSSWTESWEQTALMKKKNSREKIWVASHRNEKCANNVLVRIRINHWTLISFFLIAPIPWWWQWSQAVITENAERQILFDIKFLTLVQGACTKVRQNCLQL